MNENRERVLDELLQHRDSFLSGEELSKRLSISRTAVWKHIEELRRDGYTINAVRKQGYMIKAVPSSLEVSAIHPFLETEFVGKEMYTYGEVMSTQLIAHEKAKSGAASGTVILADLQTQGKARLGRRWHSPKGTGIWMSLMVKPYLPLSAIPQLTLLTAVALVRGIHQEIGLEVQIKWPNDLLFHGKKLCGILTEVQAEADQVNYVIIGIGMNVNHQEKDFDESLSSIATSLRIEKGKKLDRNKLIAVLLKEWEILYQLYMKQGFSPIKTLWETYALSLGQQITARTVQGNYTGMAKGITDEGILLLEDEQGTIHKIYSADIETPKT
ncbi:biotin--[acetyl-CoA-carboxylase] ligase [Bacillus horti]|uniref:Bifunctional ligase/repressor BirA n=1 Tax=Caldalkalibacillus horti TaxID=77523 RepID=A0ABT9VWX9_9BACI|nr:biotin--[acetyl-CoA-carboxylase] ligase [Bacillus horti]MDQ0165502.1 BirA family biotin operon repressor/biotin-[acetyl-CoA-carboxylase] ligase [Bacillus horti]